LTPAERGLAKGRSGLKVRTKKGSVSSLIHEDDFS